jgi:hypothetical protein
VRLPNPAGRHAGQAFLFARTGKVRLRERRKSAFSHHSGIPSLKYSAYRLKGGSKPFTTPRKERDTSRTRDTGWSTSSMAKGLGRPPGPWDSPSELLARDSKLSLYSS